MSGHLVGGWRVVAAVVVCGMTGAMCGRGGNSTAPTPTAPTAAPTPVPTVSLQSLRTTPSGVGVLHNTAFLFEAVGTFPAGSQSVWQFGDGSSETTTTPSASHIYSQTGSFGVTVEARLGASSSAATSQITVRSLVGRWLGAVTGFTRFPPQRPIPITSFDLTVNDAPRPSQPNGYVFLNAAWLDSAGCRQTRNIAQSFTPGPSAAVIFSIESLTCSDGDFAFMGTADSRFDRVEGTCNAGPNCRFTMTRQ